MLSMKVDLHYLFTAKYAQWISVALICLFSALILLEFSTLQFSPAAVHALPKIEGNRLVMPKQDSFKIISNASLFGVYVPDDLNSVRKSMLDVSLVGILFANDINESQVIIRASGGDEKSYQLGDTIPGDAVIKRIMARGILVERQGALERLSLPKNDLTFEPVASPLKEE
jgi:general secretion pathway protein C